MLHATVADLRQTVVINVNFSLFLNTYLVRIV